MCIDNQLFTTTQRWPLGHFSSWQ